MFERRTAARPLRRRAAVCVVVFSVDSSRSIERRHRRRQKADGARLARELSANDHSTEFADRATLEFILLTLVAGKLITASRTVLSFVPGSQQSSRQGDLLPADPVGGETVVADSDEAPRQDVEEEPPEKLLVSMALIALPDDLAFQQLDGGKQRRRFVAFVVMGHRAAASLLQRQRGLSPVQGLNLALLVHAEHDGLLGRIEIEADHSGGLSS